MENAISDFSKGTVTRDELVYHLGKNYKGDDKHVYDAYSIILYSQKKYEEAYQTMKKCLSFRGWDLKDMERIRSNMSFCISQFGKVEDPEGGYKNKHTEYNKLLSDKLADKLRNENRETVNVTVTMTSCKRIDLFTKTVNSFINCCTDLEKVDEWIVIDDNSSDRDRERMKMLYPFINFIFKNPEQKGHAVSMNMLTKRIRTKYTFHLEDDWLFFDERNYITECKDILASNPNYGQCLLNLNYSENLNCFDISGGTEKWLTTCCYCEQGIFEGEECEYCFNDKKRYFVHTFYQGKELEDFAKTGVKHCCYWPHYSLRVGLTKTKVFDEVGEFNPEAGHFEMEYAYRYVKAGYQTAFLDGGLNCIHIGRNTWERTSNKLNAYDLNKESQFGEKPKEIVEPPTLIEPTIVKPIIKRKESIDLNEPEINLEEPRPVQKKDTVFNIGTYVVNLDRRTDRKLKFIEDNHSQLEVLRYTFFSAIDGKTLVPNNKIMKLFEKNDYRYRKGIVGCAMSHIKIWTEMIIQGRDIALVLEDDITIASNFLEKLTSVLKTLPLDNEGNPDWDILFLGHFLYPQFRSVKDRENIFPIASEWSRDKCMRESMGGTIGYVISKRGAKNMLSHINENSVYNGIDWVMFKTARESLNPQAEGVSRVNNGENKIYYCYPHIVYSECVTEDIKPDSDIQYDLSNLELSEHQWLKMEVDYWMKKLNVTGINGEFKHEEYHTDSTSNLFFRARVSRTDKDALLRGVTISLREDFDKSEISGLPISTYTVGRYIFLVSHSKVDESIQKEITFGGHLNVSNPI
jgi:GR25 family glycosyltransferase involved in LPS biosynthesis